jgi:hypothetical protein
VATISYLGKGNKNGHGDELDREKIEGLRLQNAISRTKLAKLSGDVLDRRQVEFVVSSALVTRERVQGFEPSQMRDLNRWPARS